MPVVDPACQFPADWVRCPASIGVVRDGERLRFWFQPRKGRGEGAVVSLEEWHSGDSPVRDKLDRLLEKGALLAVGLSPDRGLVRECISPLSDPGKSAEIWPSLLESTLPFPLEDCEVAFLPPEPVPEGGSRCLAAAARTRDVETALTEWRELGLSPDVMIPEVLLCSGPRTSTLWTGTSRCIYTAWHDGRFLGAGGGQGIPPESKAFSRFKTTWTADVPDLEWTTVGPAAGQQETLLEQNAANALFRSPSSFINLLSADAGSGRLAACLRRKQRSLCLLGVAVLVLLAALPLGVRSALRGTRRALQEEIELEYHRLTGEEPSEQGQELLLATRFVEDTMEASVSAQREISGPHLSSRLVRILNACQAADVVVTALQGDTYSVTADLLGREEELQQVRDRLISQGDDVTLSPSEQGAWRLEARAP